MQFCAVNEDYLNYLRNFDRHVPFSNYGKYHYKPFFHPLFTLDNGIEYVAPISHARHKDYYKHNTLIYRQIYSKAYSYKNHNHYHHLTGVIWLNHMFPCTENLLTNINGQNINQVRRFRNLLDKKKYLSLLTKELRAINNMNLIRRSKKVYRIITKYPNSQIAKHCMNFKLLEEALKKYAQK